MPDGRTLCNYSVCLLAALRQPVEEPTQAILTLLNGWDRHKGPKWCPHHAIMLLLEFDKWQSWHSLSSIYCLTSDKLLDYCDLISTQSTLSFLISVQLWFQTFVEVHYDTSRFVILSCIIQIQIRTMVAYWATSVFFTTNHSKCHSK